jgi:hypothetical protein
MTSLPGSTGAVHEGYMSIIGKKVIFVLDAEEYALA